MIVTVTLNPALDKTARTDEVNARSLNRLHDVRLDAGGKGINVSAAIGALGGKSLATGFAGGMPGDELLSLVAKKGIAADLVRIAGPTRTNLKVVDRCGGLTEFNEPGPEITAAEMKELTDKLYRHGTDCGVVVLAGSLPGGIDVRAYADFCGMLKDAGASVFLDADGDALRHALEAGSGGAPSCIKPNRHELLQYFGISDEEGTTTEKLVELCQSLVDRGIGLVALSMGQRGAIFVNDGGAWQARAIPVEVRSTVRAGDSMMGALAYGFELKLPDEQRFALAMAVSAGACTTEGTNPPDRTLVDGLLGKVRIEKIA